jgi:hypothetical protein
MAECIAFMREEEKIEAFLVEVYTTLQLKSLLIARMYCWARQEMVHSRDVADQEDSLRALKGEMRECLYHLVQWVVEQSLIHPTSVAVILDKFALYEPLKRHALRIRFWLSLQAGRHCEV